MSHKLAQGLKDSRERYSPGINTQGANGLSDEIADKVVGDDVGGKDFPCHLRGLGIDFIQVQGRLDIIETQFDFPSAQAEFSEFFGKRTRGGRKPQGVVTHLTP